MYPTAHTTATSHGYYQRPHYPGSVAPVRPALVYPRAMQRPVEGFQPVSARAIAAPPAKQDGWSWGKRALVYGTVALGLWVALPALKNMVSALTGGQEKLGASEKTHPLGEAAVVADNNAAD